MPIDLHGGLSKRQHNALAHYPSQQAEGTTNITTGSGSFVDMVDMVVNITTGNIPVLMMFSCSSYNDGVANRINRFQFDIDGTPERPGGTEVGGNGPGNTHAIVCLKTLSSGPHVIKVQWSTTGGSASNAVATGGCHRRLVVIALPW